MKLSLSVLVTLAIAAAAPAYASVVAGRDKGSGESVSTVKGVASNTTGLNRDSGDYTVDCYDSGYAADRAPVVAAIDTFCNQHAGTTLQPGQRIDAIPTYTTTNWAGRHYLVYLTLSVEAINGCTAVIPGDCWWMMRRPVDECDTSGENDKQASFTGGNVRDSCLKYRVDPNA
ncbi:hypothetical protein B0H17DRAFT_1219982 [Mycena rosella]|uniref:Uncharacterized protein n=1 Tax=Mycena rosella TaxID=1033263 RepID=A0AAD7BEI8_MYCRO|nr:hypothetical protein B0H17DRAFT_1219982 [Mycena rosella]